METGLSRFKCQNALWEKFVDFVEISMATLEMISWWKVEGLLRLRKSLEKDGHWADGIMDVRNPLLSL